MLIAVKLDIYSGGNAGSYSTSSWMAYGDNNPTSAFRSATIEKEINCSELKAKIVLKNMRDVRGISWADDIQLMDIIILSVKTSTPEEVQNKVRFFGFITDIVENEVVENDRGNATVTLNCSSLPFLIWPLLSFDRASDPMSSVLKIKEKLWNNLDPYQGTPDLIIQLIIENVFKELVKPIQFLGYPIGDYLDYSLTSCGDILPGIYRMVTSSVDGFTDSFWSSFSVLSEIFGATGWLHEMYLDIMTASQMDALKGKFGGSGIPIPSDATDKHYLVFVMRENPLPVFTVDAPALSDQQVMPLNQANPVFDSSRWDALPVTDMLYSGTQYKGNPLTWIRNRSAMNVRTVFTMDMMIDPTKTWFWSVPSIVDPSAYFKFGYSNLNIMTNYVRAVTSTVDNSRNMSDLDKLNTKINLFSLNLRNASYNACMDLYKQGTLIIPFDMSMDIGELIALPHDITGYEDATYYIHKQTDFITCEGISTTTLVLTRGMTDTARNVLEDTLKNRLVLTKTVDMQNRITDLPDADKLGYLQGIRQK